MPITITLPQNPTLGGVIGPGTIPSFTTSLTNPLPSGYYWVIGLNTSSDFTNQGWGVTWTTTATHLTPMWELPGSGKIWNFGGFQSEPGDTVYVKAVVNNSSNVQQDSGTITAKYTTSALEQFIQSTVAQAPASFTSTDRTNLNTTLANTNTMNSNWNTYTSVTLPSLQDVLNNIFAGIEATITGAGGAVSQTLGQLFSGKTFDALTTASLGSACYPDVVDVTVSGGPLYGLQAHCTSYADYYAFTGWANDYSERALATLQIYRGGNLIYRAGLHETSKMLKPVPGVVDVPYELDVPIAPGGYRIVLTPSPDTCWTLSADYFP